MSVPLAHRDDPNLWTQDSPQPLGTLPPPALPLRDQQTLGGLGAQALPEAILQDQEETEKLCEEDFAIFVIFYDLLLVKMSSNM